MIIDGIQNEVKAVGFGEQTQSTIIASAQMIKLLSSGLYKDKIMAVLREISANAIDAMRQAGTLETHKFVVHLPTQLENYLSIRDYGTGLSDEGMKAVYINYGASTKTSSNEFIGGFGVGSKSVLAYSNDCIITSYYNGNKTLYNFGLNDKGMPTLSKVVQVPTDEHNGLEIKMVTLSSDISSFVQKATQLYELFEYRPETNVTLPYKDREIIFQGKNWVQYKKLNTDYSNPVSIKLGDISYPLDINSLPYDHVGRRFNNTGLLLTLNIGDVDIVASREAIELTPKTLTKLTQVFDNIVQEYTDKLNSDIGEGTNFERFSKAFSVMNALQSSALVVPEVTINNRKFKNLRDFTYFGDVVTGNTIDVGIYQLDVGFIKKYNIDTPAVQPNKDTIIIISPTRVASSTLQSFSQRYQMKHNLSTAPVCVVYYRRKYRDAAMYDKDYNDDVTFINALFDSVTKFTIDAVKEFNKVNKLAKQVNASNTAQRAPSTPKALSINDVQDFAFRTNYHSGSHYVGIGGKSDTIECTTSAITIKEQVNNTGIVYCVLNSNQLTDTDGVGLPTNWDSPYRHSAFSALNTHLLNSYGVPLYGVPKSYVSRYSKVQNVQHFSELIKGDVVTLYDIDSVLSLVDKELQLTSYRFMRLDGMYQKSSNVPKGLENNKLYRYFKWLLSYKDKCIGNKGTAELLNKMGVKTKVIEVKIPKEFRDLAKQYDTLHQMVKDPCDKEVVLKALQMYDARTPKEYNNTAYVA